MSSFFLSGNRLADGTQPTWTGVGTLTVSNTGDAPLICSDDQIDRSLQLTIDVELHSEVAPEVAVAGGVFRSGFFEWLGQE